MKQNFISLAERKRTIERIFAAIDSHNSFFLIGHELPDEDCIASLVSMGLLLRKFNKKVSIYLKTPIQEQLRYLGYICDYNEIDIFLDVIPSSFISDVFFILDTPKPEMLAIPRDNTFLFDNPAVLKIEIDHHLGADSAYIGDEGYRLVASASSTCELIGLLCKKLAHQTDLLEKYGNIDVYSRNIVLAVLTGIVGDTKMGMTLKTRHDRNAFTYFRTKYENILRDTTHVGSLNFSSLDDIFQVISCFSKEERGLFDTIMQKNYRAAPEENVAIPIEHLAKHTAFVAYDETESKRILENVEYRVFVNVIREVTNSLSEKSQYFGMTAYYDDPVNSNFIQVRIRCSATFNDFDLRPLLSDLGIINGGGHPGAIGFRVEKNEVTDFNAFIVNIVDYLEKRLCKLRHDI